MATKALHDAGITSVIAAGNSGAGVEMTLSNWAAAPWVIGVGATDVAGFRASFSSTGLLVDNAVVAPIVDGHVSATGDRLGIYHPSVMAPGANIEAVCPTISLVSPGCAPGESTGAFLDGTSFATPHVAGVAALLLQARPGLTPDQIRQVLEVTAGPTRYELPAWNAGFGIVDAKAAVDLVRSAGFPASLAGLHQAAEAQLLAARPWRVERSDLWTARMPTVVVGGVTALPFYKVTVPAGTDAVKIGVVGYDLSATSAFTVVVHDDAGHEVARTQTIGATAAGPVGSALLDLRGMSPAFGDWTLDVEAGAGFNDEPESESVKLTVHAALLEAKE
jgi:serine protease AprX